MPSSMAQEPVAADVEIGVIMVKRSVEDEAVVLSAERPVLIIIDYAEARPELTRLLEAVAAPRAATLGKLRVALLARDVADWWRALIGRSSAVADWKQPRKSAGCWPRSARP